MQGDIITQGGYCGISGCTTVTVSHVGGGNMVASAEKISDSADVTITPKDNMGLGVSFGLVCKPTQGAWEYLYVNEGELLLIDGEQVMVLRKPKNI